MGRTIVIANQKGGVGKTTTAVNLATCIGILGQPTLLIDMDPQANATTGLGFDKHTVHPTIYDVLVKGELIKRVILNTVVKDLFLAPSNVNLTGAEIELVSLPERELILKKTLALVKDTYRYIFIDTPPSLGLLTLNSLVAADAVLIPVQCEYYALEGLGQLLGTITLVQQGLNQDIKVEGVLLTMYDIRTNLSQQIAEEVRNFFGAKVYKTTVPCNVRLSEAPSFGKPIFLYDINSKGAEAYIQLSHEVIESNRG